MTTKENSITRIEAIHEKVYKELIRGSNPRSTTVILMSRPNRAVESPLPAGES